MSPRLFLHSPPLGCVPNIISLCIVSYDSFSTDVCICILHHFLVLVIPAYNRCTKWSSSAKSYKDLFAACDGAKVLKLRLCQVAAVLGFNVQASST